ncbi:MAG: DUF3078 domain-containing protein [Bacteroidota bacterium]
MKKPFLLLLVGLFVGAGMTFGQTTEELTAQKEAKAKEVAELEAQLKTAQGDLASIEEKLVVWPRWENGAFGVLGLNFNGFNEWLSRDVPNLQSTSIALGANAFVNYLDKKYFWRNSGNLQAAWIRIDDLDNPADIDTFQSSADAINLTSLFGYKLNEKLAASALAEYRSTIASNFNNPGYLDFGVGVTWTPIPAMVVVVHPLNYNLVFSNDDFDYQSSLGAKIVADYTRELIKGVNWKSNLSAFQSYSSSDLSNWTWINSFGFTLWKGIGVGLELGLRSNKQEAMAAGRTDNPLQTYYVAGFSYNVGSK